MNVPDDQLRNILEQHKKFCVYGLSNDPTKPSHYAPLDLVKRGWDIVGVYPREHEVSGFKIYKNLADVPAEYRKMVNVFRASDRIPEVVDEVLALGGVEVLWLQLGIFNPKAEKKAEDAGLKVISDRCIAIEVQK